MFWALGCAAGMDAASVPPLALGTQTATISPNPHTSAAWAVSCIWLSQCQVCSRAWHVSATFSHCPVKGITCPCGHKSGDMGCGSGCGCSGLGWAAEEGLEEPPRREAGEAVGRAASTGVAGHGPSTMVRHQGWVLWHKLV